MKYKIAVCQMKLDASISGEDLVFLKKEQPDFVCLPEYFFSDRFISHDDAVSYMKKISKELSCVLIGGTTVRQEQDRLFNTSYLLDRGEIVGFYKKVNLYHMEIDRITAGTEYKVFTLGKIRVGLLICADVLTGNSWQELAKSKPHLIFIPTFSPYKEEKKEEKFKRDNEIFVRGASTTGAVVVKVCGVGSYGPARIQGRSLAAGPEGIIWRVEPEDEDKGFIKMVDINLDV